MLLRCYVAQPLDKITLLWVKLIPFFPNVKAFKISFETRLVRAFGRLVVSGFAAVSFCLWISSAELVFNL